MEPQTLKNSPQDFNQPRCNGCGGPCPYEMSIPSVLWNRVIRADGPEGDNEYLCPTCIIHAFAGARVSFAAILSGDGVSGVHLEVSFDGESGLLGALASVQEENNRLRLDVARLQVKARSEDRRMAASWDTRRRKYGPSGRRPGTNV
jgi:hypothetical protein